MRKIIYTLFAVVVTSGVFAQSDKNSSESNEKLSKYGFYMMKEDYLIHYNADGNMDTLTASIVLRNGKTLTSIGELFGKNGTRVFLKEGQCVNANGNIDDCEKLKQKMFKKMEKKTDGKIKPLSLVTNSMFLF